MVYEFYWSDGDNRNGAITTGRSKCNGCGEIHGETKSYMLEKG
jgi:hypothetical protein